MPSKEIKTKAKKKKFQNPQKDKNKTKPKQKEKKKKLLFHFERMKSLVNFNGFLGNWWSSPEAFYQFY